MDSVLDHYLLPDPRAREVVVLTDQELSCSVMASRSNTTAMSGEATQVLHAAWIDAVPTRLRGLTHDRPYRTESVVIWIRESTEDGLFQLAENAPERSVSHPVTVDANSRIAVSDFGDGKGVPVEYPGSVTTVTVNQTKIYWYAAKVSLREKGLFAAIGHESSVTNTAGLLGIGLLPRMPGGGGLGVNCNGCKGCAVCAACAGCGLCGGVDLAAGVIGVDGVLGVIGLASSVATVEALRRSQ
jgi:hypothetical protein